ncbi:hypothetical protein TUBRATIS_26360 [Tubulinosema ratisbonensis]|uniref:Uncharacterized protein n=1 Tax=Tubulinosema ratisbonensis TaxID=291195 RepID=A0A437AII0_9MICR|nr:hypothetical protein TUBRATIS_26360 [Tubulinosema ratisbonensis]
MISKLIVSFIPNCTFISYLFDLLTEKLNKITGYLLITGITLFSLTMVFTGLRLKRASLTFIFFGSFVNLCIFLVNFFNLSFEDNKLCQNFLNESFYLKIKTFLENHNIWLLIISLVFSLILAWAVNMLLLLGKIIISLYLTTRILQINLNELNLKSTYQKNLLFLLAMLTIFITLFIFFRLAFKIILVFLFSFHGSFYTLFSCEKLTNYFIFDLSKSIYFTEDYQLILNVKYFSFWLVFSLTISGFIVQLLNIVKVKD